MDIGNQYTLSLFQKRPTFVILSCMGFFRDFDCPFESAHEGSPFNVRSIIFQASVVSSKVLPAWAGLVEGRRRLVFGLRAGGRVGRTWRFQDCSAMEPLKKTVCILGCFEKKEEKSLGKMDGASMFESRLPGRTQEARTSQRAIRRSLRAKSRSS